MKNILKNSIIDNATSRLLLYFSTSWLFWNAKLVLIFTDSKITTMQKIALLSYKDINFLHPLVLSFSLLVASLPLELFFSIVKERLNQTKIKIKLMYYKYEREMATLLNIDIMEKESQLENIKSEIEYSKNKLKIINNSIKNKEDKSSSSNSKDLRDYF